MNIKIDIYLIVSIIILIFFRQAESFLVFYFFVFLHEISHILAAILLKIKIVEISFLPFGVNAKFEFENHKVKEIIVALAGPLFSLFMLLNFKQFMIQNLFILIVNMLPIFPLDGGRVLKNIMILLAGNKKGIKIYTILLKIFVILILIINIVLIVFLKYYRFFFVSLYIFQIADEEMKKDKVKERINHLLNLET